MGGINGKPLIGYNKPAKKMAWWWYQFGLSLPSDLREKTYVITGTTTGTGRCAAMALAERSARVICLNRPSERAVESLEAIKEAGAEFNAKVEHIDCDLSSFDSVKSAIAKLKKACGDEGIDVMFVTSHLAARATRVAERQSNVEEINGGLRRLAVVNNRFHMPRARAVFEHVFGIPPHPGAPATAYELDFVEVDDRLSDTVLAVRREKEAASLPRFVDGGPWRRATPTLRDMHNWVHQENTAYATKRLLEERKPLDPALLKSY